MSAHSASPQATSRPILPLPKRKLRERLAPEVADSIQYPLPPPRASSSLFQYPLTIRDEDSDTASLSRDKFAEAGWALGKKSNEEDHDERRPGLVSRQGPGPSGRTSRPRSRSGHGKQGQAQLPGSTASSSDGYELFENANNKKKRKIPSAGDAALNGTHIMHDAASETGALAGAVQLADARSDAKPPTSTSYHGSGNSATNGHNVSGPGRGRYGRLRNSRSPLRPLTDSTNNWAGRNGKVRGVYWSPSTAENTGIISTAIANAEKHPPHGQENMSLLQQSSVKRQPAQFTFTCESQVPRSLSWQSPGTAPDHEPHSLVTNESWSQAEQHGDGAPAHPEGPEAGMNDQVPNHDANLHNQPATGPRTRKSAAKEYRTAARARQRRTLNNNRRHPPKPEDIWVCHFCEYEAIFGRPPVALVRQYEITDRKQRQQEEQRRAQLERMKAKHKSKKHSKLPAKNSTLQDPQHGGGIHDAPADSNYSQDTQSDVYGDEEEYEDDEYDPEDEIPLLQRGLAAGVARSYAPAPPAGDPLGEGGT